MGSAGRPTILLPMSGSALSHGLSPLLRALLGGKYDVEPMVLNTSKLNRPRERVTEKVASFITNSKWKHEKVVEVVHIVEVGEAVPSQSTSLLPYHALASVHTICNIPYRLLYFAPGLLEAFKWAGQGRSAPTRFAEHYLQDLSSFTDMVRALGAGAEIDVSSLPANVRPYSDLIFWLEGHLRL